MAQVKFIYTDAAKYGALAAKDAGTLYFLSDTKQIFKTCSVSTLSFFESLFRDLLTHLKHYLSIPGFGKYRNNTFAMIFSRFT